MAKAYYAVAPIRHGVGEEQTDGSVRQVKVLTFEVGDKVEGLSNDEMKQLWDAGVLEQRDVKDDKPAADATGETPATGGDTPSESSAGGE